MLKKIAFILLGINLLVSQPVIAGEWEHLSWSERAGVIVVFTATGAAAVGTVVVTVVCAPIVVPAIIVSAKGAATVVAAKTVAAGAAIKTACIVAAPVANTVNTTFVCGKVGKELFYSNPDQKLQMALTKESFALSQARLDFEKCLNMHSSDKDRNSLHIPSACEEEGMLFAMLAQERRSQK